MTDIAQVGPVTLPRSETWEIASAHGVPYHVHVAWPAEPAPPAGFPVIYQLDGDATFATTVESVRTRSHRSDATGVAPSIVVGVTYGMAEVDDREATSRRRALRMEAFTPELGASRFRRFLTTTLQPAIEERFAVDVTQNTLIGHSLGGLFVLDTLLTESPAFRTYVAISPSIWRGGERLWQAARAFRLPLGHPAPRLLLTVGEYEQRLAPWQEGQSNAAELLQRRQARRMVDHAQAFAVALGAAAPGFDVRCRVLAGEDHASVVLPSMSEALRMASGVPGEAPWQHL